MRPPLNRTILISLVILFAPAVSQAATYYVDANLGRDSNNGTSPATAWKTLNKITQFALSAGDVVRLKRGAQWRERVVFVESGTTAQPIIVEPYDTGALPLINGSDLVTVWTPAGAGLWSATWATEPEFVFFGDTWGLRETDRAGLSGPNEWHWDSGILTVFALAAPTDVEVSSRRFLIDVFRGAHLIIRDIELKHAVDPVQLTDAVSVRVENLVIRDSVGYAGVLFGGISADYGMGNAVQGCTITGIHGSRESLTTGGDGHGVLVWGRDIVSQNTFTGNTIHDCGGGGILLIDTSDNLVSGNAVYALGNPGLVVSGLNSSGNVVEYNEVYDTCNGENDCFGINLFMPGNDNIVRYNTTHDQYVFSDEEVGIPGFTERSGGIRFDGDTNSGVTDRTGNEIYANVIYNEYEGIQIYNYSNVTVYNNTVYNADRSGLYVGSSVAENTANNNVFRNNLVHTRAQWLARHVGANNTTFENNLYYPDGSTAFRWEDRNVNFNGWKTRSGGDLNGLAVNPQLENAPGLDFRLRDDSPAVDAGLNVLPEPNDFLGTPRPQGNAVDMGAFEYAAPAVASFQVSPPTGPLPLAVQFTDTSDPGTAPITAWAWDFDNDGVTDSAEQNPQFTYPGTGVYTVALTVTTSLGQDTHVEAGAVSVWSPPAAGFTATPASGLAPLSVQFTDLSLSGSAPITQWSWDFNGDGVEDSTAKNPLHIFGVGTHTVRLTVTDANGLTDTLERPGLITPSAAPVASFDATPANGAAPLAVDFTDTSAPGTSPIIAWAWDFDNDGVIESIAQNPTHTYTATGTYSVTLTVTTLAGSDSHLAQNLINVGTGPTAAFSGTPRNGLAPLQVQFSDASLPGSAAITSWSWDFDGDGAEDSTAQHPSHTYAAGQYSVSLTVTDANGESHTRTETGYISAGIGPTASFTVTPTTGLVPLPVSFVDASDSGSEPITAWAWDFNNDGVTDSNAQNPAHTFTQWGDYTVSLRVTTAFGSNTAVEVGAISVTAKPVANFTASPRNGLAPLQVGFVDTSSAGSSPIATRLWNFGDGATSDQANPAHTYAPGTYTVSLTVTDQDGGLATRTQTGYITVAEAPKAAFTATPTSGLSPLSVTFTDRSLPGSSPITGWLWDFGDGASSTQRNPVHVFDVGIHTVTLTVTTAAGSDQEVMPALITAVAPELPTADFDADVRTGTHPLTVQFSDQSTAGSYPITAWVWSFGDGVTSTVQAPQHTFKLPGAYTVSLTVTTAAGEDIRTKPAFIDVAAAAGPTASFSLSPAVGPAPLVAQFNDTSSPGDEAITAWAWDFGDGATSSEANPGHTYAAAGQFDVSLTVTTLAGSDTASQSGAVRVFNSILVDKDNASGIEDGASWATAFTRIQDGVDAAAAVGGVEVWVAEGLYDETRANADGALVLGAGVAVYGGFAGVETLRGARDWVAHATVIDGARARNGSAAYHVATGADGATLDGFTLRGGRATGSGSGRDTGGGLYNNGVSPRMAHCLFLDNDASIAGGAVYNTGGAPVFEACRFEGNAAVGSVFTPGTGGAVANEGGTSAYFENCIFYDNESAAVLFSTGRGGAVANRNSSATLVNCTFTGNRALGNFFSTGQGGAVYSEAATPGLTNSICWGDTPNEIINSGSGGVTATYSDIAGGYAGTGNRNNNPRFTSAALGDFSLLESSPVIDAGTKAGAPPTDFVGILRPQGAGVDMGAYELGRLPVTSFTSSGVLGVAPYRVDFTDTSDPGSAPIDTWAWDFGDGAVSAEANPLHTFQTPGDYLVRLTVTTGAGSDGSDTLTVAVVAPVTFSAQPEVRYAYEEEDVSFFVTAEGGLGKLNYRWWFNDGDKTLPLDGGISKELVLTGVTVASAGQYWCEVSDDTGLYPSASADLLVAPRPTWVSEPVSAEVPSGRPHAFLAEVGGGFEPVTLTWFKDGEAVPFTKSTSFTLSPVRPEDAGTYTVQAIDALGTIIETRPATLTVLDSLPAAGGLGLWALGAGLLVLGGLGAGRKR